MPKAKLPPDPLRVFSANGTTAILDANGNEVVGWSGFDDSNRTRAEHELLARGLVACFNAARRPRVSDADVLAWAKRNDLDCWDNITAARCAFEDAQTFVPDGVPAPSQQTVSSADPDGSVKGGTSLDAIRNEQTKEGEDRGG